LNIDLKEIIKANSEIRSDYDPSFFFRFTDIHIEYPRANEDCMMRNIMPNECRIRDLTYAGEIFVDVEYIKGDRRL
jgi:DNA-directed RNA polymerase III subunit RPC2